MQKIKPFHIPLLCSSELSGKTKARFAKEEGKNRYAGIL